MMPSLQLLKRCSWVFVLPMLGAACGWSSPENFYERSAKLSCKYAKKCEEADWKEAGFDNVKDCVDKTTSEDEKKAFADACSDFDKKAARQCLAGARKAKRKCDLEAPSDEQQEACAKVCGDILGGELMRDRYDRGEFIPFYSQLIVELPDAEE